MSYQVKQLGLGGVLDQAIKLTKDNFGLLLGIALVLQIPFAVVQGYLTESLTSGIQNMDTAEEEVAVQQAGLQNALLVMVVILVGAYIIVPLTNAAMVYAIADKYLEKPVTIGQAFKQAFGRILPLVWTWFLLGMAIMGGLMLCLIPGILVIFWFGLATQVVVLERVSGFAALKRSKLLMTGNIANLFALLLIVGAISWGLVGGAALVPQKDMKIFGGAIAQGVASILSAATLVVFYFSCRCQHEHFDLALLAQALGTEASPPVEADAVEGI